MGREQTRSWKHILIHIICVIIICFVFQSCAQVPIRIGPDYNFRKADALMNRGQYAEALSEIRQIMTDGPKFLGDKALYRLGLIFTHDESNSRDIYHAREYFRSILTEYPESSLRENAKLWINIIDTRENDEKEIVRLKSGNNILKDNVEKREKEIILLNNRIAELENQIENLKQIDLGIEQKKRNGGL